MVDRCETSCFLFLKMCCLVEEVVVEDDYSRHGLDDGYGARYCAHVVSATRVYCYLSTLGVNGRDVAHQGGDGFEAHLEIYLVAIADTALDSS